MFRVITTYESGDAITIKTENTDDLHNAITAMSIYTYDPECVACVIINTYINTVILKYDVEGV